MKSETIARSLLETEYAFGKNAVLQKIQGGRINRTFSVDVGQERFILQRLNPIFGIDGAVVENTVLVTEKLFSRGVTAPRIVPAKNGQWSVRREGVWRMMTRIDASAQTAAGPDKAAEAAKGLSIFHKAVNSGKLTLKPLPPAEYNRDGPAPPEFWDKLVNDSQNHAKFSGAENDIEEGRSLAARLPQISGRTQAVLHGDPKADNFLFTDNGQFLCLIDFDCVRKGSLIWELADSLRSWTATAHIEKQDGLISDVFIAFAKAYKNHGLPITGEEWCLLPAAVVAMTLNLARRYLKDYFEESYFIYDQSISENRSQRNLNRGRFYIRHAKELESAVEFLVKRLDKEII